MNSVLLLDDDQFLTESISRLLVTHGFQVRTAHSGGDGIQSIHEEAPDLLVLDLSLPDQDGLTLCRKIRTKWRFPILMLTSRGTSIDKVVGLEVGADDYLTKPFEAPEFLARCRALLRRSTEYAVNQAEQDVLTVGPLQLDLIAREARVDDHPIVTTDTEFRILEYLARNTGRALSREQIFEHVWGFDIEFSSNSLEVLIYRLRQKLDAHQAGKLIHTLRGFGYKLQA
ncbi:MAG: response regulator transcription factor [Armatimonadetes bacterium]|nr:response regulator transcription factor [Armatimonadota bacterium]